VRWLLFNCLLI